jgi:hypothetical protein
VPQQAAAQTSDANNQEDDEEEEQGNDKEQTIDIENMQEQEPQQPKLSLAQQTDFSHSNMVLPPVPTLNDFGSSIMQLNSTSENILKLNSVVEKNLPRDLSIAEITQMENKIAAEAKKDEDER